MSIRSRLGHFSSTFPFSLCFRLGSYVHSLAQRLRDKRKRKAAARKIRDISEEDEDEFPGALEVGKKIEQKSLIWHINCIIMIL